MKWSSFCLLRQEETKRHWAAPALLLPKQRSCSRPNEQEIWRFCSHSHYRMTPITRSISAHQQRREHAMVLWERLLRKEVSSPLSRPSVLRTIQQTSSSKPCCPDEPHWMGKKIFEGKCKRGSTKLPQVAYFFREVSLTNIDSSNQSTARVVTWSLTSLAYTVNIDDRVVGSDIRINRMPCFDLACGVCEVETIRSE